MSFFGLFGTPDVQKLASRQDVPGLLKALTWQKDAEVRQSAASALGFFEDERAIEPLVSALKDSSFEVRAAAAQALELTGINWNSSPAARRTVPSLIAIMSAPAPSARATRTVEDHKARESAVSVHLAAAKALGKIRDARAIDALLEAVQRNWDWTIRAIAAELLGEIKEPRAIKPLLSALIDSEYFVCKAAARALPRIDVDWARSEAAQAAVPMFRAALNESTGTLRNLKASPELPDTDFIPDLEAPANRFRHEQRAASEERSTTVSWAAKEALKLVGAWVDEPGSTPVQ
jgi:HEAT repeat protein